MASSLSPGVTLPPGLCVDWSCCSALCQGLGGEATGQFRWKPGALRLGGEATLALWGRSNQNVFISPASRRASLVSMATEFPVLVFPWTRYLLNAETPS